MADIIFIYRRCEIGIWQVRNIWIIQDSSVMGIEIIVIGNESTVIYEALVGYSVLSPANFLMLKPHFLLPFMVLLMVSFECFLNSFFWKLAHKLLVLSR